MNKQTNDKIQLCNENIRASVYGATVPILPLEGSSSLLIVMQLLHLSAYPNYR